MSKKIKNLTVKELKKCLIFVRFENEKTLGYIDDIENFIHTFDERFICGLNNLNWGKIKSKFGDLNKNNVDEVSYFVMIDFLNKTIYYNDFVRYYISSWNAFSMSFERDSLKSNKKILNKKLYEKFLFLFEEDRITDISLIKCRSNYILSHSEKDFIINEIKNCKFKKNIRINLDSSVGASGLNFYFKSDFELKPIEFEKTVLVNPSIKDVFLKCLNLLNIKEEDVFKSTSSKKFNKNKKLMKLKEQYEDL